MKLSTSKVLFFSLASHQSRYFKRLLQEPELDGVLVEVRQLPWPALTRLPHVNAMVDWARLVGEKCQERLVKKKYQGWLYRVLLRAELLFMALRIQALLDQHQPGAVAVWNGSARHCQLLLALLAPNCRTFYFENGLLPNTTTLDRRGVNFNNSMPRDAEFYRVYGAARDIAPLAGATLVPRPPRVSGLQPIILPDRYVFIPFQDDRDTQVRLLSPWVENMTRLFALGERLAEELGIPVVFKEHPSSREVYPELHERCHAGLLFANGNSTQELIERSEFVVTLNSTVGLESLLLGKPLLTLGQAFFNIDGVVMHADSEDELLQIAKQYPRWPLDAGLTRSFLHYLEHQYCVPGHWQSASVEHVQEVVRRLLTGLSVAD